VAGTRLRVPDVRRNGSAKHRRKHSESRGRYREGGGLRRLNLGTRISYYRCSLPGLAGFAAYRREEPTETTVGSAIAAVEMNSTGVISKTWRRERDSNPRYGLKRTHTFQACSLSHSDTSPKSCSSGSLQPERPRTLPSEALGLKKRMGLQYPIGVSAHVFPHMSGTMPTPIRAFRCPTRCWRANGAPRYSPS
jgi:hypothetical protein